MKIELKFLWWKWIIISDFILIVGTLLYYYIPNNIWNFSGRIFSPFNLQNEMNFAAWWSGIVLLIISLLLYQTSHKNEENKRSWLTLSFIFFFLFLDEIGSIHERLDKGLFILGVIGIAVIFFALRDLFKKPATRKTALFILLGFALYGFAALQEYIEHSYEIPKSFLGLRAVVEEGTELLGTFVILYGIVLQNKDTSFKSLQEIIPEPDQFDFLPPFLILGVIINSLICFMILPYLDDLNHRGNPAVWFPVINNFLLFAISFRNYLNKERYKISWGLISLFFIGCSVFIMQSKIFLIPHLYINLVSEILPGNTLLSLNQILVMIYLIKIVHKKMLRSYLIYLVSLCLLLFSNYFTKDLIWTFFGSGVFSYIFVELYLRSSKEGSIVKLKNYPVSFRDYFKSTIRPYFR